MSDQTRYPVRPTTYRETSFAIIHPPAMSDEWCLNLLAYYLIGSEPMTDDPQLPKECYYGTDDPSLADWLEGWLDEGYLPIGPDDTPQFRAIVEALREAEVRITELETNRNPYGVWIDSELLAWMDLSCQNPPHTRLFGTRTCGSCSHCLVAKKAGIR